MKISDGALSIGSVCAGSFVLARVRMSSAETWAIIGVKSICGLAANKHLSDSVQKLGPELG